MEKNKNNKPDYENTRYINMIAKDNNHEQDNLTKHMNMKLALNVDTNSAL